MDKDVLEKSKKLLEFLENHNIGFYYAKIKNLPFIVFSRKQAIQYFPLCVLDPRTVQCEDVVNWCVAQHGKIAFCDKPTLLGMLTDFRERAYNRLTKLSCESGIDLNSKIGRAVQFAYAFTLADTRNDHNSLVEITNTIACQRKQYCLKVLDYAIEHIGSALDGLNNS